MNKRFQFCILYITGSLFLLSSLMPGFSEEMNKLPSLMNHYRHHLSDHNQHLTFSQFIELHYGETSTHKNDEDHSDLPLFQCASHVFAAEVADVFPVHIFMHTPERVQHNTSYFYIYSFECGERIFQPPRA